MSRETVPGTPLGFHLISFDPLGRERPEPGGTLASEVARSELRSIVPTDVFLLSHGWMGDVPSARQQYRSWVSAMASCRADIQAMRARDPRFRPLILGIHWPSLPWGSEGLDLPATEEQVSLVAKSVAETTAAKDAIRTILRSDGRGSGEDLPGAVADAYASLDHETGMHADGPGAKPGDDREPFDARAVYTAAMEADPGSVSFGLGAIREGLLAPLRVLSFWSMKDRARAVGEAGISGLLSRLQADLPTARFHLMGHSFGCIASCAALDGREPLRRPVDSLTLMQGAMSIWSFASDIPARPGRMGYFYPLVRDRRVLGPIVATISEHDHAIGRMYPIAAGAARQVAFATSLPTYGGLGAYGVRGPVPRRVDRAIATVDEAYRFEAGDVINLESSRVICGGTDPFVGAHSRIARPEVAHAVWSAAMA